MGRPMHEAAVCSERCRVKNRVTWLGTGVWQATLGTAHAWAGAGVSEVAFELTWRRSLPLQRAWGQPSTLEEVVSAKALDQPGKFTGQKAGLRG